MSVAFGGANLKAQQGDQVGYWTLDPTTGTYAFTPQDPATAAMQPQSFMQLTGAAPASASSSMNLLPLAAVVGGVFLALTRRARRNPFRAYPGPPPSHALFGRLVGRYWWGADPPAEVVEAREARKHHKRGESLEAQIDRELAHGRELRKQLDEHRDQVPNLRDYGLDKRDEFERDVAAHNREQQRLNDEYQESGRRRYALIARRGEQQKAAETPEQKHVAELRQELRTLETLAPKMSEGAISPTQMNRMSTRQRAKYDRDMARRWQVEDELKELEKPPEQREAERQARETKAAEKARSDRLGQIESELAFRESVHHRGIGASVKRNKEIYVELLAERERLGGEPAKPSLHTRTPDEMKRMLDDGRITQADIDAEQERRRGLTRTPQITGALARPTIAGPAGAPMDVNGADQYRITMSERRRYGSPVQVPVTYDRVGPHQWAMTVGKQRKAGTLSDGMVAQAVDLARSEGRLVGQAEKQTTWTTADAPPQGMSRAEFEKRLEPRPIGDGYAVRQDVAGSGWTLIYPSGETRSGLPSRADAERRAEQHRAVTSPPAKRLWTEVHTTDTGQRWEVMENDADGKPVTVLSGSSVSAEAAMESAAGAKAAWERERAEHADMAPRKLRDFLAETGPQGLERARQEERTGRIALRKEPPGHEESPAEWRARMERRQEEKRAATAAELKERTAWVPYLDSEAAGVRRTGPTYEELGDVEHRDSLASSLDWASRVKWGAMRLELGEAGYKSKEAEDELAEFRKRAGELGYRIEHAHYGAGDRTWRFRVEKGALPPVKPEAPAAHWRELGERTRRRVGGKATEFGTSPAAPVATTRPTTEFDDTYKGPRHTYGLSYRPLGSSTAPAGWIIQSNRPSADFPFGTVQYSRELTPAELAGYQLTPAQDKPAAPANSEAKRQYEAGWKASERFGSSEGTGPTPLERADDRGAPPAWYHGYEDHASDKRKWATFENASGESVHLPRTPGFELGDRVRSQRTWEGTRFTGTGHISGISHGVAHVVVNDDLGEHHHDVPVSFLEHANPRRWPRFPGRRWRRVA